MNLQRLLADLAIETDSRIVFVVADGLGGLPKEAGGETELEAAATPHLDELARHGTTGLVHPVSPGIPCGSGPGHLALFGYDPVTHAVGRGVLSALGTGFDLQSGDVAARGNFCTVDQHGKVIDRRAGRIADTEGERLVEKLSQIQFDGVEAIVRHVKQYRFTVIFRADGLGASVNDSDPRRTSVKPHPLEAADEAARRTVAAANQFIDRAREILQEEQSANMILLRGFGSLPDIPSMHQAYRLDACALAVYPMYRGLARLLDMRVPERANGLSEQVEQLKAAFQQHTFFFLHHKSSDSRGEDGDFEKKVEALEELDRIIPTIAELNPDVLVVTGDHSTPSVLKRHSWHPVPVALSAPTCRPDRTTCFGEREAITGGLGQFAAKHLMPIALGHAGKIDKFGA